jgi:hypothetical protein
MVRANWVILEANTEISCPVHTIVNPSIPPGWF